MTFGWWRKDRDGKESGEGEPVSESEDLPRQDEWGPTKNYFENRMENDLVQGLIELAQQIGGALQDPRRARSAAEEPTSVTAARDWVEGFDAMGLSNLSHQYLETTHNFQHSAEHTIREQTLRLRDLLDRYDHSTNENSSADDFVVEEVLRNKVEVLVKQLVASVVSLDRSLKQEEADEAAVDDGRLPNAVYESRRYRRLVAEQRGKTTLDGAGIGMAPGSVGEVSDEKGHLFEDTFSDDNGEMRRQIGKKLRSMPRWKALKIIEQAVEDGMISEETARYLIREYVRSH